jgi:hypothetical protein
MAKTEKGIKFSIERKVKDWLSTIDDEELRKAAARDVIVTGGCIVSLLTGDRVRDYDIYFKTIHTAERIAKYYVEKFKSDETTVQNRAAHVDAPLDPRVEVKDERVRIHIKSAGVASATPSDQEYDYFESTPEDSADAFVEDAMAVLEAADQDFEIAKKEDDEEKPRYRPLFLSDNAITLSHGVQLIVRFYGTPEEVHANFDYVHCTCYWTRDEGLVCSEAAQMAIQTKELRYMGSLYPICALIRIRKFVARGYSINAGQFIKMCGQVNDLDLTSIAVWEDQLTGVDTVYFQQLIDILKSQSSDGTIEKSYVIKLIDKMF